MEKERPNLYKIKSENESLIRALHPTPLVSVARFFSKKKLKNPVHILDTTQIQESKANAEAENKQTNKQTGHNKYTTNN